MVTEWSVPRVTSATELWRVKAIARQHSGTAERSGSDLPFGAGQQSWRTHGREKQTSRRPENCSNNTPSKMYVKYLKEILIQNYMLTTRFVQDGFQRPALPGPLAIYCR